MNRSKTIVDDKEERVEVSFVSRWSRLKHEAKQGIENAITENTVTENTAEENTSVNTGALDEEREQLAKILTDEDMPDIKTLTPDSDYTDFLSPGVSETLRKLALRKLFHCEAFNICDGLDDYDDDFTQFKNLGDIVTSDMQHQVELKAQRMSEQLLQENAQLSDNDGIKDIDNKDNAEENKIASRRQGVSQTQLDLSQTQTVAETAVVGRALNTVPLVKADNENDIRSNSLNSMQNNIKPAAENSEADNNTEVETTVDKKIIKKNRSKHESTS